ncbi:MAG: hypothetical protein K6T78_00680 [Alicyclobacillus sp.]|nr:hypothetical protein [Alicyclobacillus sp.]
MGQNRNYVTLTIAILGAVKLILQAFGVNIITDQQIDAIGNGVAALITVIGVIMTHIRQDKKTGSGGGSAPTNGGMDGHSGAGPAAQSTTPKAVQLPTEPPPLIQSPPVIPSSPPAQAPSEPSGQRPSQPS